MDEQERWALKVASNEALGRKINECRAERGDNKPGEKISIVCECGDGDCETLLEMDWAQYQEIRQNPSRFALVSGHELLEGERIVRREGNWLITEKIGVGKGAAKAMDPRSEDGVEKPPAAPGA